MERLHVFLDESGAFGFDFSKPKCTSHVVIAAVLSEIFLKKYLKFA